ncbi:hypothetical protein BGZ54_000270 [Gamsiella multidivaricata]|nr:hypothetical protein BGZ54_000270 [Gamsiella multidivaricata]
MSFIQSNQPGNLVNIDDSTQSLAPRSAPGMDELLALMGGAQFSNAATAEAAAMRWRQGGADPNFVTSTVAPVGGHRRNHEE